MKIQIVKKGTVRVTSSICPWVVDVPPETEKK
jgi:hypothetical protein